MHESQIVALIRVLCDHLLSVPIAAAGAPAQGGSGSGGRGSKKGRSKRKKAHAAEGEEEGEETESEVRGQGLQQRCLHTAEARSLACALRPALRLPVSLHQLSGGYVHTLPPADY